MTAPDRNDPAVPPEAKPKRKYVRKVKVDSQETPMDSLTETKPGVKKTPLRGRVGRPSRPDSPIAVVPPAPPEITLAVPILPASAGAVIPDERTVEKTPPLVPLVVGPSPDRTALDPELALWLRTEGKRIQRLAKQTYLENPSPTPPQVYLMARVGIGLEVMAQGTHRVRELSIPVTRAMVELFQESDTKSPDLKDLWDHVTMIDLVCDESGMIVHTHMTDRLCG